MSCGCNLIFKPVGAKNEKVLRANFALGLQEELLINEGALLSF